MINIKELINKAAERGITVIEQTVTKNNVKIAQLRFYKNKTNLYPCVNVEDIKNKFKDSTYPIEDAINYIEDIIIKDTFKSSNEIAECMFDENTVINKIRIGVQEQADDSAFFTKNDYTNLWEFLYIRIDETATIKVTDAYIQAINEKYGYVYADLYGFAEKNEIENSRIDTMENIITNLMLPRERKYIMPKLEEFFPPFEDSSLGLYVVSNKERFRGASAIGIQRIMFRIADKLNCRYLTVIPSSIHELIVTKKNEDKMSESYLLHLVKQVNEENVKPEEKLCDRVYTFDAYTGDYDYTE